MFDSNAMAELAALKRARGGGRRKDGCNKPVSSKAFHDAQMREMSPWRRAVYEATVVWRGQAASIAAGFKWDCHAKFRFEPGADNLPQAVLPGAERATDAAIAQRRADMPLKPKASQRPCDAGLFSDQSQQKELF